MKRKFRVTRSFYGRCEDVIEAEDSDEAWQIVSQLPIGNIIEERTVYRSDEDITDDE